MRIPVREELDLNPREGEVTPHVDLSVLPPFKRVLTALRFRFSKSKMYMDKQKQLADKAHKARIAEIEGLTSMIGFLLKRELIDNTKCSALNQTCNEVILAISRKYEGLIESTLESKDFISYDIKIIDENPDMLLSYPSLPILVSFRLKLISSNHN